MKVVKIDLEELDDEEENVERDLGTRSGNFSGG